MKRSRELAELLLRKAAHDEYAFEKLSSDPEAPDEIVFFHAQQAVEKMIKAVLALSSVRFRPTHDLANLIDLVRDNGIAFPKDLERVTHLTPFAVNFRYEDMSPAQVFHLHWVTDCLRQVRAWAESVLLRHAAQEE